MVRVKRSENFQWIVNEMKKKEKTDGENNSCSLGKELKGLTSPLKIQRAFEADSNLSPIWLNSHLFLLNVFLHINHTGECCI